ncbi:unnamed protein product [Psylliodes chrysocephalus]|uniref:THAP-type domain-containing protein n=1 Tax=Psylliodes chrysocephalus TaxID=3402493 RepID=A0A9P0GF37_9CUCU|nr:unnamed protein product [Psylliodes chrysocephala]
MSGNKCQFYGCGLLPRIDSTISIFRFPVSDTERCKKWILQSGNGKLTDLSPKSLKKKFISSKHFSAEQLSRKKLPKDAVPVQYRSSSSSLDSKMDTENSSPVLKTAPISRVSSHLCFKIDNLTFFVPARVFIDFEIVLVYLNIQVLKINFKIYFLCSIHSFCTSNQIGSLTCNFLFIILAKLNIIFFKIYFDICLLKVSKHIFVKYFIISVGVFNAFCSSRS